jgi:hypothetical protein
MKSQELREMKEWEAGLLFKAHQELIDAIVSLGQEYIRLVFDDYDEDNCNGGWALEFQEGRRLEWGPDHNLWEPTLRYLAWHLDDITNQREFTLPIAYLWDDTWKVMAQRVRDARITASQNGEVMEVEGRKWGYRVVPKPAV